MSLAAVAVDQTFLLLLLLLLLPSSIVLDRAKMHRFIIINTKMKEISFSLLLALFGICDLPRYRPRRRLKKTVISLNIYPHGFYIEDDFEYPNLRLNLWESVHFYYFRNAIVRRRVIRKRQYN